MTDKELINATPVAIEELYKFFRANRKFYLPQQDKRLKRKVVSVCKKHGVSLEYIQNIIRPR